MMYHNKMSYSIDHEYDEKYDVINDFNVSCVICHCWWHGTFSQKQIFSLKSFIATQKSYDYKIIIWHDNIFSIDPSIKNELDHIMSKFDVEIREFDYQIETQSLKTPSRLRWLNSTNLAAKSDNVRVVLLFKYGGFWFDLDCCFLRDMNHCFISDFAYEWEFQDYGNSALMYFKHDSQVLNSIVEYTFQHKSFAPWDFLNYKNSYLANMTIYPCYMFDPMWENCVKNMPIQGSFSKFFTDLCPVKSFEEFSPNSFVHHWHNNWNTPIAANSCFSIFNSQFSEMI